MDKVPTKSSTKAATREWLTWKEIPFDDADLKRPLGESPTSCSQQKTIYKTDQLAEKLGHTVLRTPVTHSELNPIELGWSNVKRHQKIHNKTFKLADLEQLVPAALQPVTPEIWRAHCDHVVKKEDRFWESDGLQEDRVEQFIITNEVDEDRDDDTDFVKVDGDVLQPEDHEDEDVELPESDRFDEQLLDADAID